MPDQWDEKGNKIPAKQSWDEKGNVIGAPTTPDPTKPDPTAIPSKLKMQPSFAMERATGAPLTGMESGLPSPAQTPENERAMGIGAAIGAPAEGLIAGGAKAAPAIIRAGVQGLAGSAIGSWGGRHLGEIVGAPGAGAAIGSLVGGLTGGVRGLRSGAPEVEPEVFPLSKSPGPYRGPSSVPKVKPVAPAANPFPEATPTDPAHAQFLKNFGPEYKEAGDLAEWETGNREGGPVTGGWNTTSKFGSPSLVSKFEAPKPEVEGVEGSIAKPSSRLVLLPEELAGHQQMQKVGKKLASENGMLYAAGMRPAGGGRVPFLPTGTKTPFAPPPPESIEFDEFGRPKEKP